MIRYKMLLSCIHRIRGMKCLMKVSYYSTLRTQHILLHTGMPKKEPLFLYVQLF